jgi:allophanate hydrolase
MIDTRQLDISISGLQRHYANGDFTPRELVQHLLTLDADDRHNAWITLLDSGQLEPYLARLDQAAAGELPLFGIPFAIKDNIDLAGIDTTAACEAFRHRAGQDATVVRRLIDAGAIPMGKTNLDQFATGLVGTRSPFGACRNAFNPDYISGGSSAGSAVATALGQVSFALGTDTAGSGRIPAAFNRLVGVKPSRGLISTHGVVPACRSLDCVSIFALSVDDAQQVLAVAEGHDPKDAYSRRNPFENGLRRFAPDPSPMTLGIPAAVNLEFFGDADSATQFEQALQQLRELGHRLVEIDISELLAAARLLYEGPWVAERYLAIEPIISKQADSLLPEIRQIIGAGRDFSALDAFAAGYRLQTHRQVADDLFANIDALVTPTSPTCYRIDELQAQPIERNSHLGTYTNYMNLLDLCAVSIPTGFLQSGVGFGITLQAPAWHDRRLMSMAAAILRGSDTACGALAHRPTPATAQPSAISARHVDLVVCGAHLDGMPLNWQLTERGAVKQQLTTTSANYRLYAMADGRPALYREEGNGVRIEVEVWRIAQQRFGSFVADIPAPLGIGKVELADGRWLTSFIAEPRAMVGATDISPLGGWRNYRANLDKA